MNLKFYLLGTLIILGANLNTQAQVSYNKRAFTSISVLLLVFASIKSQTQNLLDSSSRTIVEERTGVFTRNGPATENTIAWGMAPIVLK